MRNQHQDLSNKTLLKKLVLNWEYEIGFCNKQQNVALLKSYFIHDFLAQISKRCLKLC
jgi:hypothetical protein